MDFRRLKIYLSIAYPSIKYALIHHHPFKKPVARPFSKNSSPLRPGPSGRRLKCLLDHYTLQFNDAACSVGTVATVLNCARETIYGSSQAIVTQKEILDTVRVVNWKERILPSGNTEKRGLPLKQLGIALQTTLIAYKIPVEAYEVVYLTPESIQSPEKRAQLKKHLVSFENSDNQFIIAHFNQGFFLKGLHLPHISPVGAFDQETGAVLVLDVDKSGPGSYWIPFDVFFKALSDDYNRKFKRLGYSGGGYVWFSLRSP